MALVGYGGPHVVRAQSDTQRRPPKGFTRCKKFVDITFPQSTTFPHNVSFAVSNSDVRHHRGDKIVIREVRGTRADFAVGSIYLVRGEYTLSSLDRALLVFSTTAKEPGEGCTKGNPRGRIEITRGSGAFELASPIPYLGYPHIWFRVGDESAGGVYFGSGAYLKK